MTSEKAMEAHCRVLDEQKRATLNKILFHVTVEIKATTTSTIVEARGPLESGGFEIFAGIT